MFKYTQPFPRILRNTGPDDEARSSRIAKITVAIVALISVKEQLL